MLISIITAAFNCEKTILNTYNSIKDQTYDEWEWIITDDCSSDSTRQTLDHIAASDTRVKVFSNDVNSGAAFSRNKSIAHSSGEFIAFIDSDDLWVSNKLESQINFMISSSADFCFTAYELIDANGNSLNSFVDSNQSGSFTYRDMLLKRATLGCSTVMLRRSAFSDISMPDIRTGQDYATWLKLLRTGTNAVVLPKVLTKYRILPDSISRNKFKKSLRQWYIYREIESLSLVYSLYCFCNYAWRAVFRK